MRILGQDPDMEVYLLDDPYFPGIEECLVALAGLFGLDVVGLERDQGKLKDTIKAALLRKGGDGRRIVTLIVDEGQKITVECLELLRELLNFETNTHKLLQIVMGIEPFLVSSVLVVSIAQRLVRRICPNCAEPYTPAPEVLRYWNLEGAEGSTFMLLREMADWRLYAIAFLKCGSACSNFFIFNKRRP